MSCTDRGRLTAAAAIVLAALTAGASPSPTPSSFPSRSPEKPRTGISAKKKSKEKAKSSAKRASHLPTLLQEVSEKYRQAGTLEARFTQVTESSLLKQKKTSSGVVLIKRPDKVRWETLKPDKNLLVSDGRKFWFYTPPFDEGEAGQVIERKSSEVKSKLAHVLLSGSFGEAGDLKIRQDGPSRFILIPKKGTAGTVTEAAVEVDPTEKLIRKVVLQHKDGNRAEITLEHIELGKDLDEDYFKFEAPPGTDRVES